MKLFRVKKPVWKRVNNLVWTDGELRYGKGLDFKIDADNANRLLTIYKEELTQSEESLSKAVADIELLIAENYVQGNPSSNRLISFKDFIKQSKRHRRRAKKVFNLFEVALKNVDRSQYGGL